MPRARGASTMTEPGAARESVTAMKRRRAEDAHMFTVTRAAAKQIRRAAASGDAEELALRVAATRTGDGGIDYRMGFDEIVAGDRVFSTNGIDVVIAAGDEALLDAAVLDYVEIEAGDRRFIFLNPGDPHYRPPVE